MDDDITPGPFERAVYTPNDYATVSLEILDGTDRDDSIALEVVANGPGVPPAIDKLIATAFAELNRRDAGGSRGAR